VDNLLDSFEVEEVYHNFHSLVVVVEVYQVVDDVEKKENSLDIHLVGVDNLGCYYIHTTFYKKIKGKKENQEIEQQDLNV
jgi:hypothetical protein